MNKTGKTHSSQPKKILVVVSSLNEEYQNSIIKGIRQFTSEHNFIVTIITAFGGIVNIQSHENGENAIYQLIDFNKYDGAILMTNTIISDDVTFDIISLAKHSHIPVVSIDYENGEFYSILTDNVAAQSEIVEHLITEHKMKKINYVSGPPTNPDAIQRLRAYKKVLAKHDINFDSKRVYEGHFLEFDGEPAVAQFLAEDEYPEAIVCANDEMAMGVVRALESRGLRVPEDIAVTGYDNIYKAKNYYPSFTTVGRPLFETGYTAAKLIYNVINGDEVDKITYMKTTLIKGDSCGCQSCNNHEDYIKYKKSTYNVIDNYMKGIPQVNKLNIYFTECCGFDDFIEEMKQAIDLLECESFALCVCDKWLTSCYQTDKVSMDDPSVRLDTYTENMHVLISYNNGLFHTGDQMRTQNLLPDSIEAESGDTFYFSPIHYQDICIGYCCIKNSDYPLDSALYYTWLLNIDSALEHLQQKTRLNAAFNRLSGLYGLDQLTNIYNRVGFYQVAQKKFDMCVQFHRKAMIMFIDMDGMKKINDTYGHNEGDYALIALAAAIKKSCNDKQICARFGGDEFVVFQPSCGELCGEELSCRIQEMITEHNRTFGKPYDIEASIGYYIIKPTDSGQLAKMIEIADEKMYEEKRSKNAQR